MAAGSRWTKRGGAGRASARVERQGEPGWPALQWAADTGSLAATQTAGLDRARAGPRSAVVERARAASLSAPSRSSGPSAERRRIKASSTGPTSRVYACLSPSQSGSRPAQRAQSIIRAWTSALAAGSPRSTRRRARSHARWQQPGPGAASLPLCVLCIVSARLAGAGRPNGTRRCLPDRLHRSLGRRPLLFAVSACAHGSWPLSAPRHRLRASGALSSGLTAQLFAIVASLAQFTSLVSLGDLSDTPFERLLADVPVGCLISAILSPCVRFSADVSDRSGPSGQRHSPRRPSSPLTRC